MGISINIFIYIYICRKSALNRYPNVKLDSVTVPYYRCMIYVKAKKIIHIQVVPGRAGGGSFKRKKNYIAKKEFANRMCAR